MTGKKTVRRPSTSLVLGCALIGVSAYANAQTMAQRRAANPPSLELRYKDEGESDVAGLARSTAPPIAEHRGGRAPRTNEAMLDLNVVYVDGALWNPVTQRNDKVRLRSYQGTRIDPEVPFISPTLDIRPGSTIRIKLHNRLPADPSCLNASGNPNQPHCFNGTNLHAHGLWVNPSGNGDNVLISINPNVDFEYEYNIASDHPAGTFWYHTHRHGSTALQVSSGMAGALIVRGDRVPTPSTTGDLDTLLRPTPAQSFTERLLVLQQIQYACRNPDGSIKINPDNSYRCDENDVGGIEPGPGNRYDLFGPATWAASGRYTTINGRVLPTFDGAKAGQIERWRMIHGGVRDTINLQFRKLEPGAGAANPALLSTAQQAEFIDQNCTGPALPQHLVAADGLTTAAAVKTDQTVFQPAYRWDALMVFPEKGTYCVIDASAPAAGTVSRAQHSRRLLALVEVKRGRVVGTDLTAYLTNELAKAAAINMPRNVRAKVVADLRNGLKLASFVPHPDVQDAEVTGTQDLAFNIDITQIPPQFQINGRSFQLGRVDRELRLGSVDEWTLTSNFASHPFHIHVNPFQIVKVLDPSGKDVSGPDAVDDAGGAVDPQYRGLKGVWKDSIWVKSLVPPGAPPGKYTVVVRTRYQRYIGDFVVHCHILDHEDQGMMQLVRISLPDGAGGTSGLQHSH